MTVGRRVRFHAGLWGLVAALGLTFVFVLAAAPRTVNRIQDQALQRTMAEAPYRVRDLMISGVIPPPEYGPPWPDADQLLSKLRASLPRALDDAVGGRWGAVSSGYAVLAGPDVSRAPNGLLPKVTILYQTGFAAGVHMIEGVQPHNQPPRQGVGAAPPGTVLDIMVSEGVARDLGLQSGGSYELASRLGSSLRIRITGLFALIDQNSPAFAPYRTLSRTGIVVEGSPGDPLERMTGTIVTDQAGISFLQTDPASWDLISESRFRLDERLVDADDVGPLSEAVARLRSRDWFAGLDLETGLDDLLADFARRASAVRALLAVVVAGIAGTALGLLLLSARLAVDRRRHELALLRARGASLQHLVSRLTVESTVVVLPGIACGWLAHLAVPGRAPDAVFGTGWAPVVAAILTLVAIPLMGAAAHRHVTADVLRRDLVRARTTPVRLTVEAMIVVLAIAGVLLVRRRGISQAGVDPYLAAVPVLVGTTAGLLALRLYPWAMRLFGWFAARHRSGVAFLGLARAGRVSVGTALPLVVIVLAVAVGGFASSVRVGLSETRDVASARLVGGDLRLSAAEFAPDAVGLVAGVPGVTAVAAGHLAAPGSLRTTIDTVADPGVAVLVLDAAAYQRVLERIGLDLRLPVELASARPGGDVPVVVSPGVPHQSDLAVRLGAGGLRRLRVVATLDVLPGLSRVDFVVVPREALGADAARISLLFVAGPHADPAAVRAAARAIPGATPDDPVGPGATAVESPGVALVTRVERRHALERSGFNDGITLAFNAGAAAALIAGLLAIGLALVVDAAARGRVLSLLRTMGLGSGQARRLLAVELMPLMVMAMATGAAVGVILPVLLGPALGLSAFTAGAPLAVGLDIRSVGLLAALLVPFVMGGLLAEAAVNRRLGLGQVLRVS